MKAVIWTKYGLPDGLKLQDIPKPEPKENEVCIKIYATTVVKGDCEMRSLALPFALRFPMRLMNGFKVPKRFLLLGQEFAGIVDAVGSKVAYFKKGDRVFGATGFGHGTYAEYICLPIDSQDDVFINKPDELTFEEAAAIPVGALEALHFLRKGKIQRGETVLVNGAGGSIGTMAVQLAKTYDAKVAAVDSTEKLDMLRSIGADYVIDYTKEDFTNRKEKYDVIFDVVGKASYRRCISSLKQGGRYLLANPTFLKMLRSLGTRVVTNKKTIVATARRCPDDLLNIIKLIENGELHPVIDKCFVLEKMADAHRYVDSGHKKGNVVVTINS